MREMDYETLPSSFRDPSGALFERDGVLYRRVHTVYQEHYDRLMGSGLYRSLTEKSLLIPHHEIEQEDKSHDDIYKRIKPELIPFISYPYEWCFGQLKDAALLTLAIQKEALEYGMTLKDASAYNVQFIGSQPVWIDTLSFEIYQEGRPWVAYRQFCQHFLAPLTLISAKNIHISQLLRVFLDGIPLDVTSALLPLYTYFKSSLLTHIHLHAKSQKHFAESSVSAHGMHMGRFGLRGLIDSLESAVKRLTWDSRSTHWANYQPSESYSPKALQHKKELVRTYLNITMPKVVWDMGAGTGTMSRIAGDVADYTVSLDGDPGAVEKNYHACKEAASLNILPLWIDVSNPSPPVGWENEERMSFMERGPTDTALVLALVHHLVLTNNVPMEKLAHFFARVCNSLIIEFVPKNDPAAQRFLRNREDIFQQYNRQTFDDAFRKHFKIMRSERIQDSQRVMYCMRKI